MGERSSRALGHFQQGRPQVSLLMDDQDCSLIWELELKLHHLLKNDMYLIASKAQVFRQNDLAMIDMKK